MKGTDIKGIIPAIVTPFKKNGGLDLDALRRLTRFLIDSGVHAIMTTGGTGEFPLLLRDEKKDVIATVANEARGQLPIIAGTAACGTKEALLLS